MILCYMNIQDRGLTDHKLKEYDWSTQMELLATAWEGLKCCTTEHGAQFVMIPGTTMMPRLLAGEFARQNQN